MALRRSFLAHLDGEEWIEVAILVGVAAGVRNHSGASAPEIH
jgi:hypothetical protein